MKIVDVCEFYAPEGGGVRTYIHAKLAAGARHGHEVVVIAPGREDKVETYPGGGRLITVKGPALPFDPRYGMFWRAKPVHDLLDQERPDVLEASSPWRGAWIVASWRGEARRSLFMHHDPLSAWAYRWFDGFVPRDTVDRGFAWFWRYLRSMCSHYDLIVCAAPSLSKRLADGGISGTVTLPLGVDEGLFSPKLRDLALRAELLRLCNLDPTAKLAIGVGRHTPEKRWPVVIDACTIASAKQPLGLLLIGDGHQRSAVLKVVGDNPHVHTLAPIRDRTLLARILASGDMLVHGSAAETFGLVAAEARASGLPLILPDEGAANDLAGLGYSETYKTGSRASAAEAILRMLARDPAELRAACVQVAQDARTVDTHLDELFEAYAAPEPLEQRAA